MKTLSALVLAAAIGLPFAAHAATDSYSASRMHYNIYGSGSYATMPFVVPSTVPRNGITVTSVNYTWSSYNNGNTSEIVELVTALSIRALLVIVSIFLLRRVALVLLMRDSTPEVNSGFAILSRGELSGCIHLVRPRNG